MYTRSTLPHTLFHLTHLRNIYWLPRTNRHLNYFQLFSMTKTAAVTFLYGRLYVHELSMPSDKILEVELLSERVYVHF